MKKLRKPDIIALVATLAIHLGLAILLWFVVLKAPQQPQEEGIPVMLGEVEMASGTDDPGALNGPDQLAAVEPTPPSATPQPATDEPMITQEDEPTVSVKKAPKEPEKKKPTPQPPVAPVPPKKTEAQLAEEARQAKARAEAQARAEAERAAAAAANSRVAGALGRGSGGGNKGTSASGDGSEGTPTGNSSTGVQAGTGGRGTVALSGRSLRGSLPPPGYNVNEEGDVVVKIVVNAAGTVISASLEPRGTNTGNASLRSAALTAAKRAVFNAVEGASNQTGTITYHFRLK